MTAQNMAVLFRPEPIRWGLRGDPYLWREMASTLTARPLPQSAQQLDELLQLTFERLVGVAAHTTQSFVFVERYSHGGMSSGHISPDFWRETGFTLLQARHAELTMTPNGSPALPARPAPADN